MSKVKSKTIVSVGVAIAFCVSAIKIDTAKANPALAPAVPLCATGAGTVVCVLLGVVVLEATYRVWKNNQTGEVFTTDESGKKRYNIDQVVFIGIVRDKETCESIARRYEIEYGGTWEVIEPVSAGISTPESEGIPSEQGYLCQIIKTK
ncbi:hypothetical protein B4U84_28815 [Westiellopsis prolifica IICB1]|nr:hypothetical protein B4U84_28815 [Westiellopsis prolifica IICB1]